MPVDPPADLTDVFLSHHSADKPWVRSLLDELVRLGLSAWLDERVLPQQDNFVEGLSDAGLCRCRFLVLVVTRQSLGRPWVKWEWSTFMALSGPLGRVIPVLLEDVPLPPAPGRHPGDRRRRPARGRGRRPGRPARGATAGIARTRPAAAGPGADARLRPAPRRRRPARRQSRRQRPPRRLADGRRPLRRPPRRLPPPGPHAAGRRRRPGRPHSRRHGARPRPVRPAVRRAGPRAAAAGAGPRRPGLASAAGRRRTAGAAVGIAARR